MSCIFYKVRRPTDTEVCTGFPELFIRAMTNSFGNSPWILEQKHVEKLSGMRACTVIDDQPNPYTQLIAAVNSFKIIEVFIK